MDVYINVQGDEPFIAPTAIDTVSDALHHLTGGTLAVNAYTELDDAGAGLDHNVVKVVLGTGGNALMFSRQPILYPRGPAQHICVSWDSKASPVRLSAGSGSSRKGRGSVQSTALSQIRW
ncbi:hypothetical protein AB0C14_38600 [Microbispora hainanensis]|uniref:cytidylyltransferase domain-containing protein n=1 Tax=Microbispora hainanensis TaxID=568844 RepID=UPI003409EF24